MGDGRSMDAVRRSLRLNVDNDRRSPESVDVAGDTLRGIPGVSVVATDPRTGSLVIGYEPAEAPRAEWPNSEAPVPPTRSRSTTWAVWLGETLALVAVEIALQQALGPLFLRRRC